MVVKYFSISSIFVFGTGGFDTGGRWGTCSIGESMINCKFIGVKVLILFFL